MSKPPLSRIFELVGESTTLWNQVEELWYLIFTALMSEADRDKVDAIYDMFFSGQRQRDLIMRVAPVALKYEITQLKKRNKEHHTRKRLLTSIGQLNARTQAMSGRRNAVVHTAFEWSQWQSSQVIAISPNKPSKLSGVDHQRYLTELIEDTLLLVLDLADLREDFIEWLDPAAKGPKPWKAHIPGYREPRDVRQEERDRVLQAVAQRKPLPPLP